MSLKSLLNTAIKQKGYLSYQEMESICKMHQKKISNGERRLRESPFVEPVLTDKGAIKGYRWSGPKKEVEEGKLF